MPDKKIKHTPHKVVKEVTKVIRESKQNEKKFFENVNKSFDNRIDKLGRYIEEKDYRKEANINAAKAAGRGIKKGANFLWKRSNVYSAVQDLKAAGEFVSTRITQGVDVTGRTLKATGKGIKNTASYIFNKDFRDQANEHFAQRLNDFGEDAINAAKRPIVKVADTVKNIVNKPREIINKAKNKFNRAKDTVTTAVDRAKKTVNTVKSGINKGKTLAKNAVRKGKQAAAFIKNAKKEGGAKNAAKKVGQNLKNRLSRFKDNAPQKIAEAAQTEGNVVNSVASFLENGKNRILRVNENVQDKIVNWIQKYRRAITFVIRGGSAAIITSIATVQIVGILGGVDSAVGGTPHYYCDVNAPKLLRDRDAYKLYCANKSVNGVIYFQQDQDHGVTEKQAPWRNEIIDFNGESCTLGECGCGRVAFTMAAATFSDDITYTPDKGHLEYAKLNGGKTTLNELNLEVERIGGHKKFDETMIKEALDADCFVQVCLNTVGQTDYSNSPANGTSAHFILIVGYDESGFYIADSYTSQTTMKDVIPGEDMDGVDGQKEEPYAFEVFLNDNQKADGGNAKYCPISKNS